MTRTMKFTCAAYTALFASAVLAVLSQRNGFDGIMLALYAIAIAAVPVAGYLLSRRRSLLSFTFAFLPALALMAWLMTGSTAWAVSFILMSFIYVAAYNVRPAALPEPRFTTQKWVSSLLLSEVILVLVLLLALE